MTRALVRRTEGTIQKTEPPKITRWQRFKIGLGAINHFKSPGTAVALERLRSGVGTPEERQPVRERLVRKGVFEAVETVALEKAENGPYRTAPVGTVDTTQELATLKEIAEQGIRERRKRRIILSGGAVVVGATTLAMGAVAATIGAFTTICAVVAVGAGAVGVGAGIAISAGLTIGAGIGGICVGATVADGAKKTIAKIEIRASNEKKYLEEAVGNAQRLLSE